MPVIINEFEVITEPPPQQAPGEAAGAPAEAQNQPPAPPSPLDVARIISYQAARLARVRAH